MPRDRRNDSPETRLALAERDLDFHDVQFADLERRNEEQDARLDKLEETKGANRTAFWTGVGTILTAILAFAGVVIGK